SRRCPGRYTSRNGANRGDAPRAYSVEQEPPALAAPPRHGAGARADVGDWGDALRTYSTRLTPRRLTPGRTSAAYEREEPSSPASGGDVPSSSSASRTGTA